jgi:hypothetical protein
MIHIRIGRFSLNLNRRPSFEVEDSNFDWEAHSRQLDRRYAWQERLQKRMSA